MVTTSAKHAIPCGNFTDAWKEWTHIPEADKTWPNWKTHGSRDFKEKHDIQRLTGGTFKHQANSALNDELSKK